MKPAKPSARRSRYSAFARVGRLASKELREILRDRRTILTLFAMPILLYPLMSVVFKQFNLAASLAGDGVPAYHIGVLTKAEEDVILQRLHEGNHALAPPVEPMGKKGRFQPEAPPQPPPLPSLAPPPKHKPSPQLKIFRVREAPKNEQEREAALKTLLEMLRENQLDLIVLVYDLRPEMDVRPNGPSEDRWVRCRIISMANSATARAASNYIDTLFAAANEADLKRRLNTLNVGRRVLVLNVRHEMLTAAEGTGAVSLAALIPLILILMTVTGAVYPAIDLTAGERERGTLEILIAAPVSRFELLCAKYFSVLIVAVLTAMVNLTCMFITIKWSGLGPLLFGDSGFSFLLIVQVFSLLLVFAGFFSAVLLCMTSFARSFKEAQAYLIPLMIASLSPGIMAMMPSLKLSGVWTVLPLLNIILMARDLFEDGVELMTGSIVVMSTIIYALAALSLAARVFGAESVLYSEQSTWADMFRRPETPQPTMSISMAMWCLALMVPIQFCLVSLLLSFEGLPPLVLVLVGIPLNLILFGCLPGLFIYVGRVELASGLGLRVTNLSTLLIGLAAGIQLGMSLWPMELFLLSMDERLMQFQDRYGAVLGQFRIAQDKLGWGVLALVIVPAILEELFFRGLLFNALRKRCNGLVTIGLTGILFGLSHVILDGGIGLERLMPTTLLGLILSGVRWRAGNLWPSMVLHVCHNSFLLMVGIFSPGSTDHIPWTWLVGGAVGVTLGTSLLWFLGDGQDALMAGAKPYRAREQAG